MRDEDRDPLIDHPPAGLVERLWAAGCIAADEEAVELQLAAGADRDRLESFVRRREQGIPLAWITGSVVFCRHRYRVASGVFVPRARSEEVAHRAASLLPSDGAAAELCAGGGVIAAHLARSVAGASVVAVDLDPVAVRCALANGVPALVGDLDGPLRSHSVHVVAAVAPYVPSAEIGFLPTDARDHEPLAALDGGPDGLDVVRPLVAGAARILRPGGWLVIELGGSQDQSLAPDLAAAGFEPARPWFDEDDDLVGLAARLST